MCQKLYMYTYTKIVYVKKLYMSKKVLSNCQGIAYVKVLTYQEI